MSVEVHMDFYLPKSSFFCETVPSIKTIYTSESRSLSEGGWSHIFMLQIKEMVQSENVYFNRRAHI